MTDGVAVLVNVVDHYVYRSMKSHTAFVVSDFGFFGTVESMTFALVAAAQLGDIVQTEHHVLRRNGDRRAVGGVEDVVGTEHKHLCLKDSFVAKGKVDGHLVTVEVGVECRTCERVELDCLAFDELGLECLYTEAVQSRGTVEQHRVSFHHMLEDIPYDGFLAVDDLLGALDGLDDAALDELADDERLAAMFLGRPHSCICSSGPTTITERAE